MELPFFFRDTELKDFIGSVWFKRTFHVSEEMAGKEAKLWLGTIVDSDTDETGQGWPIVREQQRQALAIPNTGMDSECEGPQVDGVRTVDAQSGTVILDMSVQVMAGDGEKGSKVLDFELGERNADGKRVWFPAKAELSGKQIILRCGELSGKPAAVRYCFANTNRGALIYNGSGFPMSPFLIDFVNLKENGEL